MNFLMTLGLVTVLVGYAKAGVALSVKDHYESPPKDELEEDYYGESITEKKPILVASDLTSEERVDKTESPKRAAIEHTGEDGKSNAHHHDEETDGGNARVASGAGKRGEDVAKPLSQFGGVVSKLFESSENDRRGNKEEYD